MFMKVLTDIFFYLGMGLYLLAPVLAIRFLRGSNGSLLPATRLALGGALLVVLSFLLRWFTWGRLPVTPFDALNLFILLSTLIMVLVTQPEPMRALQCFYLPALAIMCLINVGVALRYLNVAPKELPVTLRGLPLTIHIGLIYLAYALFFVASMTSVAYVFQSQRLKRRQTSGLFHQLPSLEQLDRTLYRLISYGYPFFVITMLIGIFWAWAEPKLLGEQWWLSPKIILSAVMVAFYSVSFHTRRFGLLRGRKLAYFVFFGFTSLLATSIVLALLNLSTYNFWGKPS
ncbi:MAG: cytochrome c biogenesis protein CcsA [Candidatus Hydrogenedentes bacterium]|nr:cytochrome c biogenesis protein CcsA [Candidatus Hydrogenedentota bacterium]